MGAPTPEEAVRRSALAGAPVPEDTAQHMQVHGVRTWEHGRIVLYSLGNPQQAAEILWSYQFVERGNVGWHATAGKGFNHAMFEQHQSLRFRMDSVAVNGRDYVVVFGQVDAPGSAVEVLLMNKQVLRDTATPTLFLVLLPMDITAQELRIVNRAGQVVERIDVSPQMSGNA